MDKNIFVWKKFSRGLIINRHIICLWAVKILLKAIPIYLWILLQFLPLYFKMSLDQESLVEIITL